MNQDEKWGLIRMYAETVLNTTVPGSPFWRDRGDAIRSATRILELAESLDGDLRLAKGPAQPGRPPSLTPLA